MRNPRRGYTMIEIVISILLTAVMVSAVFSVALTAKKSGGKTDRRLMASQVSKSLGSILKNYVTADNSTATTSWGPNFTLNPNGNGWSIDLPFQEHHSCQLIPNTLNPMSASMGPHTPNIYALTQTNGNFAHCLVCVETHPQSSLCYLPKPLRELGAVLYYTVDYTGGANNPPQVNVGVWWNEP